ncbi:MAG: TonB-dependent receptor domain-containing protein [Gemmatimonadota bacterium]
MSTVRRSLPGLAVPFAAFWLLFLPTGARAQEGGIAGIVRDSATSAPLSSVSIAVVGADGSVAGQALSGADGAFRLGGIPAGTYSVQFSAPGLQAVTRSGVTVTSGEITSLQVEMVQSLVFRVAGITTTVSRGALEKETEAPASVTSVERRDIEEIPTTTTAEHVMSEPGVDVIKTGLQSNYIVVRGFNNIFSGATLTLTDNRIARVPSLRANISHLNPVTNLDLQRIEVVLGPGSALYGPNAASGVIHSITKSPIDYPGVNFSVAGGLRMQQDGAGFEGDNEGLFLGEGRIAIRPSDQFGIKLSGQYFSGTEWEFTDETEAEQAAIAQACVAADFDLTNPACLQFSEGLDLTDPADQALLRESVQNVAAGRDNDLERWTADVRLDWRPSPGTNVILSGGRTTALSSVDLTGLGAAQVIDWAYSYLQGRFSYRDFFAQAFWNRSDNEDTYLLRSGRPLIDKSQVFVGQLQNTSRLGDDHELVYGADLIRTLPRTEGTINGQNEDDDDLTEVGGYAQWKWAVDPKLDFVAAARLDDHSRLEDPVFSPRAALVLKLNPDDPDRDDNLRLTFNRAFSTPTTLNLFLDISGGRIPLFGPFRYDVRATGSTDDGHQFVRDATGIPMHMSPFAPLFGADPRQFLPTTTPQLWVEAVAAVSAIDAQAGQLLQLITAPTGTDVSIVALTLDPSLSPGDPPTADCPAPPFCLTPGGVAGLQDIERLDPTITNTLELGYSGMFGGRARLGVNAWWSHITDFVSALQVSTPNVFLNGQELGAYLTAQFLPLVGIAFPDQATAQATAAQLAGQIAGIPLGVVTTGSVGGTDPALALVYRNLGSVDVFGGELFGSFVVGENWEVAATLAVVDKDEFESSGDNPEIVPLNAPTLKGTGTLRYRDDDSGLNGMLRFRAQNGFPANSGVYIGDVAGFGVLDLGLGYKIPGWENVWLQVDVQNVLDNQYQSFVGAPELGRFALVRVRYDWSPF